MSEITPTPEILRRWLDRVDLELSGLQRQIEPLTTEQARLQERKVLLRGLLSSVEGTDPASTASPTDTKRETVRERVHRQAVEILTDVGRLLHIDELHAEFITRGYEIPGQGRTANISVHLAGWTDIASPVRGSYGLVEQVGVVHRPNKTKRPTRRKR